MSDCYRGLKSRNSTHTHTHTTHSRTHIGSHIGLFLPVEPRVCLDRQKRRSKMKNWQNFSVHSNRITPNRALGPRPVTDEIRSGPDASYDRQGRHNAWQHLSFFLLCGCYAYYRYLLCSIQHCSRHRIMQFPLLSPYMDAFLFSYFDYYTSSCVVLVLYEHSSHA